MNTSDRISKSAELSGKIARELQKRVTNANDQFNERTRHAWRDAFAEGTALLTPWDVAASWSKYWVDAAQRSVLFWDTLRQRGNNYRKHVQQGQPPVLRFQYETIVDGRTFERPVNYALLRILPPPGVTLDPKRRPYLIIDPRAGHGPGIGGFKDDSQVGMALREGHPVYFVSFFRDPEPGQTLFDVRDAERRFVHEVRSRHPDSPKPAILGNCQGGWAAMMLASSEPDETGPIMINGAPMSYWGGAWRAGEGDNPMRYVGGMLGGAWTASLAADLGNGKFDGALLVQNMENLNPANTFWDKYYHVFANADNEPPRFLEFERWWGGYSLMNREEIEWITRNLFVGNQLWLKGTQSATRDSEAFDLRELRVPIILFASLGDNITPPQQAFNWVADIYGSTEEIKARGQVIVGLLHQDVGHLGIFVSGKVAKKEYKQIVSVMKTIELLPPGLYGMHITQRKTNGRAEYEVEFHEHRLEDVMSRLNRFQRADEKPFEAVAAISDFNQRAYELFAQPLVRAMSNDFTARVLREFNPLRFQRWAFSDLNPWLAWLGPTARRVKTQRESAPHEPTRRTETMVPQDPWQAGFAWTRKLFDTHSGPLSADDPMRRLETMGSELISASLDLYRGWRDAFIEATFFHVYGNLYLFYLADQRAAPTAAPAVSDPREQSFVQDALATIDKGGYPEAFARVAYLITRKGDVPLSRLEMRQEMMQDYREFLPPLALDQWRRIRGTQEIIARYEPERAIATLPALLRERSERDRLLTLIDRLAVDERVRHTGLAPEQIAALERIHAALGRPAHATLS